MRFKNIRFRYVLFFLLLALSACREEGKTNAGLDESVLTTVNQKELELRPLEGLFYYKNLPFTGTGIAYYADNQKAATVQYVAGKKHGFYRKWFADGPMSFEAEYVQGKLHGQSRSWWKNGHLRSAANFRNGKGQGVQRQWYKSGAKFKEQHLVDGREEGMQRAWRENGKIYNNYEAKNGRIFGLKRANLCYELESEVLQYKD